MESFRHEVFFFLDETEDRVFTDYCKSVNINPYMVGKTIVRDFMMNDEMKREELMISDAHGDRIISLEGRVKALVKVLCNQARKCEKLEEEIAFLQHKIDEISINIKQQQCSKKCKENIAPYVVD